MFKCKHCGELNEPNPNKHVCGCGTIYWRIDHNQPYPDNGKYDEYWAKKIGPVGWITALKDQLIMVVALMHIVLFVIGFYRE